MEYFVIYIIGFSISLILSAFTAGLKGSSWSTADLWDSLFWPLTLMVLLGLIVRITYEKIKDKNEK